MKKTKINVELEKIETIWHISDTHIRNFKRHNEYREVFSNLYNEIKKDTKNAIIVFTGDLVHSKLEMSPELVQLSFEFLRNLSDILPTIIIAGNHDCNIGNTSRLDVISPISKNMQHPNFFYFKDSGIYEVGNIKFVVMSIFDEISNYIKADQLQGETKIALYHGIVNGSTNNTGFKLLNEKIKTSLFDGYDIVLLGDIHKEQILQKYNAKSKKPQIAYPGSLLAQNFGEDNKHGILKWNISTRTSQFIPIHNDYGFITLVLENNIMPNIQNLPSKARIRLKTLNTSTARVTEIMANIRQRYPKIGELMEIKQNVSLDGKLTNYINIGDVRSVVFQNNLIRDFLLQKYTIDLTTMDKIFEINKKLNSKISNNDFNRNIIWKPKKFEFTNLFSYGKNNNIDFSQFKGIVGLIGENKSGKSNLIESLVFNIFDKSPKVWKSSDVLNNKKNSFSSKFNFEIGGRNYFIKRNGKKNKDNNVNVKNDFLYKDNSKQISLNGDRRSSTNNNIRNYLGSYDDFATTTLMAQADQNVFSDLKQTDRKNLLTKFLDLEIFQELYDIAHEKMKEVNSILKEFEKKDFSKELAQTLISIKKFNEEYEQKETKKVEYDILYKQINDKIKILTKNLYEIDKSIINIDKLNQTKIDYKVKFDDVTRYLEEFQNQLKNKKSEYFIVHNELKKISNDINEKYEVVLNFKKQREKINIEFDKHQIKIQSKFKNRGILSKFKFDSKNCDKCKDNERTIKINLLNDNDFEQDKIMTNNFEMALQNIDKSIENYKTVELEYEKYIELTNKENKLNREKSLIENEILKQENLISNINNNLDEIENNIKLYYSNKEKINNNNKIQKEIDDWEQKFIIVEKGSKEINKKITEIYGQLEVVKEKKEKIETEIKYIKELEQKSNAYKYYCNAVDRNGIPFNLLSKTIPLIESEVNNILTQIVDFKIMFEIDESKNIHLKIVYSNDDVWSLALASGMEKFISNVAIRVALLSLTTLPHPNFLIIDEGMSVLDSDFSSNLNQLFDYLRNKFDFILIVSHIDKIKDLMDETIEVSFKNGYSQLALTQT